jgi:transposase
METLVERCAGLDVHKDSVTACVRVPDGHGGRHAQTRRFTTTAGLVLVAEWLASYQVTRVGMESTGCYWKPVWHLLEGQVECWLLNAAHLHNVPGRKTDVADAAWIAQLVEHGLVRPSFEVAPPGPGAARVDPLPQDPEPRTQPGGPAAGSRSSRTPGPELSSVATDSIGASGRAMLEALVAGTHDPQLLAALAKSSAPDQAAGAGGGPDRPVPHRPARAAGRPDPGPHRLPRRDHRHPLGAEPGS